MPKKRVIICLLLATMAILCWLAPSFGATGLPFFRKSGPSLRTKEDFREVIARESLARSGKLRIKITKLASRLSIATGLNLRTRADILQFLDRSDVTVASCDWKSGEVDVDSVRGDPWRRPTFGSINRGCYPGERVLSFKGKAVLSLYCGNTLFDRRIETRKVSESFLYSPALKIPRETAKQKTEVRKEVRRSEEKVVERPCQEFAVIQTVIPSQGLVMGVNIGGVFGGISTSSYVTQEGGRCD